MALKPIEILINAKDEASGVFDRLSNKLKVVGAAVAGYFGIKAFAGIVEGAAEFEGALSRVKAATGASADEMARLKQAAEDAGANTKYTSVEAAAALENLAKAGLSAGDAIETLPAVLALAQAGDIELATSAEYVTKAVMGMGLAFSDAGRVADVLAMGANATNTSVEGLAQALSYAAPTAASLGVSLEGTVAIIGKFADAGIDASRAGTALNSIMSQFSDPASKFRSELAAIGITTGDFETALRQMAESGARGSKAINAVGLEAGPALKALLNQGIPSLTELKAKLDGAAGSAAATAKVMEDNLNGSLAKLTNVWTTVKQSLGVPVLPILTDAVNQLAGAFRGAVADGTIQKFGEAIATAFQAAIQWAKEFVAQVDFAQLTEQMRGFADRAGEWFTKIGEHAAIAGNSVQLAYGVMSGGANAVMTGIYGIAASYTEAAIRIVDFSARASDALAKISIGKAKEDLQKQAADMRGVLVGLSGVRDEFIAKTLDSLDATAQSAQTARDGFAGMTGAMQGAAAAAGSAAQAQGAVTKEIEAGAAAAAAYGVAQQKKATADQVAAQTAEENRAAIAQLRAEYAALVASGSLQGAAEKLREINQALQATVPASKDAGKAAAEAAAQIDAAFARLGVTSSAALKEQAANAQRDYETIRAAGTSTAQDIGAAFKAAADKAIAANNGIAPSWVAAQAAAQGYKVAVDGAGKATLELKGKSDTAAQAAVSGHQRAAQAVDQHRTALEKLNAEKEREIAAQEKANDLATRALKLQEAKRTAGTIQNLDAVPTFNSREEADAWLAETKKQYQRDNPFTTKSSGSLGNAGMDLTMAEWRAEVDALALRDAMKNAAPGGTRQTSSTQTPNAGTSTTTVNITVEGTTRSINTDAQGAATLQDLVRQLAQAKGTASIR